MLSRRTGKNRRLKEFVYGGEFVSSHGEGCVAAVTSGGRGVFCHREDSRLPLTCDGIETQDPRRDGDRVIGGRLNVCEGVLW